ncbi:ribosomal protein rpS22, plastidal [Tribonema minus]|uniref:Ribosomal protein rpS22, plastidal n=1 Tax=Tribonema minus TaxID=303371 RepID=A0A835ZQC8_9STRA|nr:ribosomal protein rpS22, plastidal [Tribonema minus]
MSRSTVCLATAVATLSGATAFVVPVGNGVSSFSGARSAALYTPALASTGSRQVLKAVMQDSARKPVLITGNNIDVTPALMDYVNKKMDKVVEKLGGVVTKVDVHLSVNKNPRIADGHVAEVTCYAKGTIIRATEHTDSMYSSIDLVSDRMGRKLRKYKERSLTQKRSRTSISEAAGEVEEAFTPDSADGGEPDYADDGLPHVDMSVVKSKSFPMPPCTVEDAVTALEYIDHDFYVFRNSATSEVNVVYKRNHGGVGHIQPERD